MSNTYQNQQLEDIEQLKNIFPDGEADERNWCVLSTSGVTWFIYNVRRFRTRV
ncbi:hypothetical protein [Bacillus cytotoxicus]|uniref:hypothetical protein n=1 Tax=Bacillus cytotoxicus TaxID=580165 RepID=UPI0013A5B5EE|nr:hypothetical protein [Bacillus cytotoxicus]